MRIRRPKPKFGMWPLGLWVVLMLLPLRVALLLPGVQAPPVPAGW